MMASVFFLLALYSCAPRELTEKDMYVFLAESDNGYTQKVERNGILMQLTYKPTDLLVNQELKSRKIIEKEKIDALRKHYKQYAYFMLSISTPQVDGQKDVYASLSNSFSEFSENIQRFSFQLPQYVYLTDSKGDTTYLTDFNTPRLYGFSKNLESLLVFKRPSAEGELKIQCRNLVSNLGLETFIFQEEKLRNEPQLKFNE